MEDEQSRVTETKGNQKSPSETWNIHGGPELGNIVSGVLAPVNAKLLTSRRLFGQRRYQHA